MPFDRDRLLALIAQGATPGTALRIAAGLPRGRLLERKDGGAPPARRSADHAASVVRALFPSTPR